jgi:hypothetical protein
MLKSASNFTHSREHTVQIRKHSANVRETFNRLWRKRQKVHQVLIFAMFLLCVDEQTHTLTIVHIFIHICVFVCVTDIPCVPRHTVQVGEVSQVFCQIPGIPSWWHFPESDRHLYYKGDSDKSESGRLTSTNAKTNSKKQDRSGYCVLCKVKHNNAKLHADSEQHRKVVDKLMSNCSKHL